MAEEEGKQEEEKFDFTRQGEAPGYISLDQARVLAMRTASEAPGNYGRRHRDVAMAFEVVEDSETEDHYVVTLSFRPQGRFTGTPGQEQFFIEKEGAVAVRQVLGLPTSGGIRRFPVVPAAIGLLVVVVAVVAWVVFADSGDDGGDDGIENIASAAITLPPVTTSAATSLPPSTATPATLAGAVPALTPAPTPTLLGRPGIVAPTSTSGSVRGLRRGITISGRVTDGDTGLPLANVRVRAENTEQDGPGAGTDTGADGRYTISGVAPGSYRIRAETGDTSYIRQFYDDKLNYGTADIVTVSRLTPVVGIDISLKLGATISGTVTDEATGLPIADIEVHAEGLRGGQLSWTMTDRNGEYITKGLPNGVMEVSVRGQTYIQVRRTVTISGTGEVAGVDIALKRGATILGRVTDSETGLPIAGIEVHAGPSDRNHLSWTKTDGNGNYTTTGLPGGVIVVVVEGQTYIKELRVVTVREADELAEVDIAVKRGATISGTVTDRETGLPIAGMDVHAGPEDRGMQLSWTRTDANGNYTTKGLPNGVMEVIVEDQGYIEQRKTVIIRDGVDVPGVDF